MKFKLNVARDVDIDDGSDPIYLLNLPAGWKFDNREGRTKSFLTMKALREAVKNDVIPDGEQNGK
jgi:hypothetical protein